MEGEISVTFEIFQKTGGKKRHSKYLKRKNGKDQRTGIGIAPNFLPQSWKCCSRAEHGATPSQPSNVPRKIILQVGF